MDVKNYKDFWFDSPEVLLTSIYQTTNVSLIDYNHLYEIICVSLDWYFTECELDLIFKIDEKLYQPNAYLRYQIFQRNKYKEEAYIWFGEVIVSDYKLPEPPEPKP
jgi:hypothetical protein